MGKLGKIKEYSIRNEFSSEREFSDYLSQNLDILNKKIGIDFSDIEGDTEVPVGRYRCDVTGGIVAIENQFGDSDHNHLGKLLVYFSNQDVKIGVWICENAMPEHIKAVQWLNERSEEEEYFFLLEAKMIKIDDSNPAVDFDLIVGQEFKKLSERESIWKSDLKDIGDIFTSLRPGVRISRPARRYRTIPTGESRIHFEWVFLGNGTSSKLDVALHLEKKDEEVNKEILSKLLPFKPELDNIMGEDVHFGAWSSRDSMRMRKCRKISIWREFGESMDEEFKNWAAETMVKMYEFLNPKLLQIFPTLNESEEA